MSPLVPGLIAVVMGVAAGLVRWPMRPRTAMITLTITAAVAASAASVVVFALAGGFLARLGGVNAIVASCPFIPLHHQVGPVAGVAAVAALVVMVWRVGKIVVARRLATSAVGDRRIVILDVPEPVAYAVPSRSGCVVVSAGLMATLTADERRVVFAHERAHLRDNHHRYMVVAALAQALLPALGPLVAQVRHAAERSADECAVRAMGGDRRLVATAIARAALAMSAPVPGLSFGGSSVPRRVEALLAPSTEVRGVNMGFAAAAAAALVVSGAFSVQLHHLAELVDHLCGG